MGNLVGNELAQLLRGRDHGLAVASHLCRRHHEVHVMRIIPEPIDAHRRVGVGQVFFIDLDRSLVVFQRVKIAADPIVDVARHVHEMAGTGDRAA